MEYLRPALPQDRVLHADTLHHCAVLLHQLGLHLCLGTDEHGGLLCADHSGDIISNWLPLLETAQARTG